MASQQSPEVLNILEKYGFFGQAGLFVRPAPRLVKSAPIAYIPRSFREGVTGGPELDPAKLAG
jgi:hypothetical protein